MRIRFANGHVVRARAGEPFGDGPQRLSFDARPAGHDMLPAAIGERVVWKKRSDDLSPQLRPEKAEWNAHPLVAGQLVVRIVELRDEQPIRTIAGDAFGQPAP